MEFIRGMLIASYSVITKISEDFINTETTGFSCHISLGNLDIIILYETWLLEKRFGVIFTGIVIIPSKTK